MKSSLEIRALGWALLAALLCLCGTLLLAGIIKTFLDQNTVANSSPEIVISPALVNQGHQFYDMSCSHCHGDDAHGDEGPDLHHLPISNAHIATTIKKGIKGQMPTFAKKYNDQQIAALVSYLRSLD